jgi:hypothetical protein
LDAIVADRNRQHSLVVNVHLPGCTQAVAPAVVDHEGHLVWR